MTVGCLSGRRASQRCRPRLRRVEQRVALVPALEPLDAEAVDRDLWEILRWMISSPGGPWTLADLDATGRLYRIP
jgi:hypothetical protein